MTEKIKVTLQEIDNSFQTINLLGAENFADINIDEIKKDFPKFDRAKTLYDIKKRLKLIRPEFDLIIEQKTEIYERVTGGKTRELVHPETNEKVFVPEFTVEQKKQGDKEIKEFLKKEIELDMTKIEYSALGIYLTPDQLNALDYLIEE